MKILIKDVQITGEITFYDHESDVEYTQDVMGSVIEEKNLIQTIEEYIYWSLISDYFNELDSLRKQAYLLLPEAECIELEKTLNNIKGNDPLDYAIKSFMEMKNRVKDKL